MKTFEEKLSGRFENMLAWGDLEGLWEAAQSSDEKWYIYEVGHEVPEQPLGGKKLARKIKTIDDFLRAEHKYDYCGIVYADTPNAPSLIKVYGPKNLGVSCGSGSSKIWPRWIFSLEKPCEVGTKLDEEGNPAWWKKFIFRRN